MNKTINDVLSIRENEGKNRRLGFALAAALMLYIGAVIAFIVAY
jgi:hypothetical protein